MADKQKFRRPYAIGGECAEINTNTNKATIVSLTNAMGSVFVVSGYALKFKTGLENCVVHEIVVRTSSQSIVNGNVQLCTIGTPQNGAFRQIHPLEIPILVVGGSIIDLVGSTRSVAVAAGDIAFTLFGFLED